MAAGNAAVAGMTGRGGQPDHAVYETISRVGRKGSEWLMTWLVWPAAQCCFIVLVAFGAGDIRRPTG